MRKIKDLNGKTFGEWTVIEFSHLSNHGAMWKCKCSCGNEKIIRGALLTAGKTKSCGHKIWNKKEIAWKIDKNGCWICTSHKPDAYGYPQCNRNYRGYRISRLMYEKYIGEIPKGMCICHKCDNPSCINPNHLFLGTQLENIEDMNKKGRHGHPNNNGEKHPMAKLTNEKVKQIRNEIGLTITEMANKYKISRTTICRVRNKKGWKHI